MTKNSHAFDPYWLSASFLPVYEWLQGHRTRPSFHELDHDKLSRHFVESGSIQWFFAAGIWQSLEHQNSLLHLEELVPSLSYGFADGALYHLNDSGLGLEMSLRMFCRLWNHIHGYIKLEIFRDPNSLRIECQGPPNLCTDLELDFWLALIASLLIRSPQLGKTTLQLNSLTGDRLRLDQRITQQHNPAATRCLQLHTSQSDTGLGYNEFFLDAAIGNFVFALEPSPDVLYKATHAFLGSLGDWPDIEAFAEANSMTTRSLQRRLQELGLNYSSLIDIHRRQLAYLLARYNSPAEVADLLGYHEATSYARAFSRWYG